MSAVLSRLNVYEAVTEKIVAAIEEGPGTYKTPWLSNNGIALALPTNAATHAEYRGVNIVALWAEGLARGYATGQWASYKQWQREQQSCKHDAAHAQWPGAEPAVAGQRGPALAQHGNRPGHQQRDAA